MAILWADNFDNYGTNAARLLDGIYADYSDASLISDPDPSESGKVIYVNGSTQGYLRHVFSATGVLTAGIAARFWLDNIPDGVDDTPNIIMLCDTGNSCNVSVSVEPTGILTVCRGINEAGGTVLGQSTVAMTAQAWNHVEVKAFADSSAGTVEVRLNGVPVITLTGQNTVASLTNFAQVRFASHTGGFIGTPQTPFKMKDYIAWDTSGTENTDFLGTCHVYTLRPDGDSSLNWDTSTGATGWDLVDEETPDDADYISADDTLPAATVFTMTDLPPDIVSVKALIPINRSAKIDGGDGNLQMGLTTNGATDLGADRPITTAFTYWFDVSELSPDTGFSWTPTEVNNLLYQIDRTT